MLRQCVRRMLNSGPNSPPRKQPPKRFKSPWTPCWRESRYRPKHGVSQLWILATSRRTEAFTDLKASRDGRNHCNGGSQSPFCASERSRYRGRPIQQILQLVHFYRTLCVSSLDELGNRPGDYQRTIRMRLTATFGASRDRHRCLARIHRSVGLAGVWSLF